MAIQHHPHTRIGTCGFAERYARLFVDFDIIEVPRRFMQLLRGGPTP